MSHLSIVAATAASLAVFSLVGATSADARKYRHHHHHHHRGVSVMLGAPLLYDGYRTADRRYRSCGSRRAYGYAPRCRRDWVTYRGDRRKWRCLGW